MTINTSNRKSIIESTLPKRCESSKIADVIVDSI